jgi:hypothetical protein
VSIQQSTIVHSELDFALVIALAIEYSLPSGNTAVLADKIPVTTHWNRQITILVPLHEVRLILCPDRFRKLSTM